MNRHLLVLFLLGWAFAVSAWTGEGTPTNPYLLSSEEDLATLRNEVNRGENEYENVYFALTNDIELTADWIPIGGDGYQFKGNIDGRNFGVKNVRIASERDTIGFFTQITDAAISNFRILSGSIVGDSIVGGLVGLAQSSRITNCANAARVEGKCAGGIAGRADVVNIEQTFNIGTVESRHLPSGYNFYDVGGIVGFATATELNSCYNAGVVSAASDYFNAGGLVGESSATNIKYCYNIGRVKGKRCGALLGLGGNDITTLTECYSDGQLLPDLDLIANPGSSIVSTNVERCATQILTTKGTWGKYNGPAGYYPCFTRKTDIVADPLVRVSAAAAVLTDGETVAAVASNFTVGDAALWSCNNHKVHFADDGTAVVDFCKDGTDSALLTVAADGFERSLTLAIANRCVLYSKEQTMPVDSTICADMLPIGFGDKADTRFTASDFDFAQRKFTVERDLVFATINGCDSVVTYRITCYPLPTARRSDDMAANPIKIIKGGSVRVVYELDGVAPDFTFETSDDTPYSRKNPIFARTLNNIDRDTVFYLKSLSCTYNGHTCEAAPEGLADTVRIKAVDEVDIVIECVGNGTMTDISTNVAANGRQPKTYSIEPADGWYLSKLENNLDEYAAPQVYVTDGGLRYAFTPMNDTKLTATFVQADAWNGGTDQPFGTDTILIYTPDELAWVAYQTNNGSDDFKGKTIIQKNNLDMGGRTWMPIDDAFAGTFDANCKTVTNVQQVFASDVDAKLIGFHVAAGEIESADTIVESDYGAITIGSIIPMSGGTQSVYEWYCNGAIIDGATDETYTIKAGLAAGSYSYARHATGGCQGDPTRAVGEYKLTVNAPQEFEITFDFNADGGVVNGDKVVAAHTACHLSIEPHDGFFLESVSFNSADLLDSVYVEGGLLKLAFTPQASGSIEVKFGQLPAWDGTVRKPFMTRNRDSIYIYIPHELAWVAQQFAASASGAAPARAPYTRADVDWMAATVLLQENLDCGGVRNSANDSWNGSNWEPIGSAATPFAGVFDGQQHEIGNLYINDGTKDYAGLFGATDVTAELKNFAIVSGSIEANNYAGNVVGLNKGKIHHCYNMSEIRKATDYVGGLVGRNEGTIKYAYNVGLLLETKQYGGGIVGYNAATGTIDSVYCAADVWSGKPQGAIAGQNDGTLTSAFWDNQMAIGATGDNKNTDISVIGKKTAEMFAVFAGDTENWVTADGLYPRLKGMDDTDAARVSAAPILLYDTPEKSENAHGVKHDFVVSTANNVTWASFSTEWIEIGNSTATIKYNDCYGSNVFLGAELGTAYKKVQVSLRFDGDFKPESITTYTDYACSVADIKPIEGKKPTGGNSDTYVYKWIREDADGTQTDEAIDVTTMEYKPKVTEAGTYIYTRWTKDNACAPNYLKSDGVWTLVLLPEFDAGEIEAKPTMLLCDATEIPTLSDSIAASGGDGDISYRWLMDDNPIVGAAAADYTPAAELLADNLPHKFRRQAQDGKCNSWTNSGDNVVVIQLLAAFDAGSVKPVANEKFCLDSEQVTLQAENEKAANGGDGNYTYRWTVAFSNKDGAILATKTEETDRADLKYVFDKPTELPSADYPIFITIKREAKDGRCHDLWTSSANTVSYIMARNESHDTAISVCYSDFPYTYEYTYNATAKGTKQVVFDNPGDIQTITDDETEWGCIRTVRITANATPVPQVAIVDSLLEICEGESNNLFVKIEALDGNPTKYKLIFADDAFKSVAEYTDIPADHIIPIVPNGTPAPRIYTAELQFLGGTASCESDIHHLQISVSLDGYLHQKWNDVIVVDNSGAKPGKPLTFVTYQWYRNGQKVDGATLQHIYEPDGLSHVYYAVLTSSDGTRYRTCDFYPQPAAVAPSEQIKVYPVPVRKGEELLVELPFAAELLHGGTLEICNAQGVRVYEAAPAAALTIVGEQFAQGIYLARFVDSTGHEHTAKFIVK